MMVKKYRHTAYAYFILLIFVVVTIFPIFWMVSTSLKAPDEVFSTPIKLMPRVLLWKNYSTALHARPFFIYTLNSLFASTVSLFVSCFFGSLAAVGFTYYSFPGKKMLYLIVLSSLIIPVEVIAVPLYLMINKMGLLDTYAGLIIPMMMFPLGIFIIKQYLKTFPADIYNSAIIDGANGFTIYSKIILPLIVPALTSVGIFSFVMTWNNYLWPLLSISDDMKRTLSLGMALFENSSIVSYNQIMAIAVFGSVPLIILFLIFQNNFVSSISMTGLKEG
ncbi:carbohydrate ABC transporter permease [Sediminispirochaeta smaragdinae]|nr:carbohydrate ABC transporter permease [Sediminispirochaeta smaragdinae]